MNRILVIACFMLVSLYAFSQTGRQSVTTSQTGGRYEIVQSEIMRSLTFKLDKYTGEVYKLVKVDEEEFDWKSIRIYDHEKVDPDCYRNEEITYQLFMGSKMAEDCFLLNIETGDTWQLMHDKKLGIDYFYLMKSPMGYAY